MFNVIIVDDEEIIRDSLSTLVNWNRMDCTVVGSAANGEEALTLVRSSQVDIVISDLRMPKMDGLELIKILSESHPQVECIILSGYDEFEFARQAMKFGVKHYLLKPLSEEEIEEVVIKCVEEKSRELNPPKYSSPIINKVVQYLYYHFNQNDLSLKWISEHVAFCNQDYLGKLFRKQTGASFSKYLLDLRIEKAKELISRYPDKSLYSLAEECGFSADGQYFSSQFKKVTNLTPSEYRNKLSKEN